MQRGPAYAFSAEKRVFDVSVAGLMAPAAFGSRLLLARMLQGREGQDHDPIFRQPRHGTNGSVFDIRKLRTLDSETGQPLNAVTARFRRYGIDELPQARHILAGRMGVVGHRPLPPAERAALFESADPELVDRWRDIVEPTKPGLVSSFALACHQQFPTTFKPLPPNLADCMLEADIQDVIDGSLSRDVGMLGTVLASIAAGDM